MNSFFESIVINSEFRSSGEKTKKLTLQMLFLSSAIFIALSILLYLFKKNDFFILLFLTEGMGQFFLGLENKFTLSKKDYVHRYFNKNFWGMTAASIFGLTLSVRFLILLLYLFPHYRLFRILGLLHLIAYFLGIIFLKKRLDAFCGTVIFSSSLVFAVAFFFFGYGRFDQLLGLNQALYALLLVIGVFKLRPWIAEGLNIVLWIWLFQILMN